MLLPDPPWRPRYGASLNVVRGGVPHRFFQPAASANTICAPKRQLPKLLAMDTGISAKDRAAIAKGLSRLLADTYVVYLKTHNFHWNVEGPMFQTLHQLFMEQ